MNPGTQNTGLGLMHGFTLIEIMIVVAIIGFLAMIAVPAFMRSRTNSENIRFVNDLRIATEAFEMYNLETGRFPPDQTPGVIPPEMADYLTRLNWASPTIFGGHWDWDYRQFGYGAGVSVRSPTVGADRMAVIDSLIDDGDLLTGNFRQRLNGYINIILFTMPPAP